MFLMVETHKLSLDEEQLRGFIPKSSQRRMALLSGVVAELTRRKFKALDETNPDDLQKVVSIISDMHPEATKYKVREYALVAIRLWRRKVEETRSTKRPTMRTARTPNPARAKSHTVQAEP